MLTLRFRPLQVDFQMDRNELKQVAAWKARTQSKNLRYTWQSYKVQTICAVLNVLKQELISWRLWSFKVEYVHQKWAGSYCSLV